MKESYKKLIFIALSILVVGAAIFGFVRPRNEKTNAVNAETAALQSRYDELLSKEVNRQQYLDDTEAYYHMYDAKINEFPSNWDQEYQIMFIQGVRNNENIEYDVHTLGMMQPSLLYSIGGSNSEGTLATTADGSDSAESTGYQCYTTMETLSYEGSYDGVKAFMDYVATFPYRMTLDGISIGWDDTVGNYIGTMSMNIFYITGNGREEQFDVTILDEVNTGVENIFEGGESAGAISKYAGDNGDAIKSDYDLFVTLNPADSDASAKTVGVRSTTASVTSSKNESETVTIKISQDGSTYTAEFGIGVDKQIQEFDPGDDLTLLIQSSDLKDETDLNAVSITINNTSDKTLYVKVAGDESANRVKIANRAGSVVVYR